MFKIATSTVFWLGRATVFVVGLAVMLALVLGVATTAFGADGAFFKVGKSNFASAVSVLDKSGAGPALKLLVDSGPPLAVNSTAKVSNLNADKVDGQDAPLWAVINLNGTTARGFGVTSSQNFPGNTGNYSVTFNRNVSGCAYVASLGDGAGNTFQGEISATRLEGEPNAVIVATDNSSGVATDEAFHLAVLC